MKKVIDGDIYVIEGIALLAIIVALIGSLLEIFSKTKFKAFIEMVAALMGLGIVVRYFVITYTSIKAVGKMF